MAFGQFNLAATSTVVVSYFLALDILAIGSCAVYTRVSGETNGEFISLDCSADGSQVDRMVVGIQDRHYWFYPALKDTDHLKCAQFSDLRGLRLQPQFLRISSSAVNWNQCPSNSVLVALYDHQPSFGSYFNTPDIYMCGNLSAGFMVDTAQCEETIFQPPFDRYQADRPAHQVRQMQCTESTMPAAITAMLVSDNAAAFWLGIRCCKIIRQ